MVGANRLAPGESSALAAGAVLTLGATRLEWLLPPPTHGDTSGQTSAIAAAGSRTPPLLALGVTLQFALRARRHRGRWWALALAGLALLLVGGAFTLATLVVVGQQALGASGVGRVVVALALPLLPALGVGTLVTLIDRYEREPFSLLCLAFLWGALIGVPLALFAERGVDAALAFAGGRDVLLQSLSAGLLEEGVKGAGLLILLLALRDQFDNVTDGIMYGLVIGAGFALVENFAYLALSPASAFPGLILDRVLLGWLGHSTFSAILGASLGYWRETHTRRGFWRAVLLGFVAAAALHIVFDVIVLAGSSAATNLAPSPAAMLLVLLGAYAPLFGAQALLLRTLRSSLRRESETIRTYLAPEVLSGSVTPEEYITVQDATIRLAVERRLLFDGGLRAYRLGYSLHQTLIGLAMRKWHVAAGDPPKLGQWQPEDAYRQRIATIRAALTMRSNATR